MKRGKKIIGRIILRIFIAIIVIIEVYPLVWLILSSFKTTSEFTTKPAYTLPERLYLGNYVYAWTVGKVSVLFKNTVIVTIASLLLVFILSSTMAFALSKMKWKLSNPFALFIRLGMFIPPFVLLLPQFIIFRNMGVINTLWALIISFGCNISMAVYLLTGFYRYIPDEILESSVIDGCNIFKVFYHIALPLTVNGYVTVLMLTFFAIWNNLLVSQTFVSSTSKKMLQAGLAAYVDSQIGRDWGATFAAIAIAVIPTVLVYLVLSKKVIAGVTAGSVKG